MDFINSVKLQGQIVKIDEVWKGNKGSIWSVRLLLGKGDDREFFGLVKMSDEHVNLVGFGVGAWIQINGRLSAREGKDGRWWGEVAASKVAVAVPAIKPEPSAVNPIFLDDDIPF